MSLLIDTVDIDPQFEDCNRRSPLWWATEGGHERLAKLLLARDEVVSESVDD